MSSLPFVKKFSGINSLYYWNNLFGRKILLLGELHLEDGGCDICLDYGCSDVDNFILNIVRSKNICLDYFIEEGLEIHPSSSLLKKDKYQTIKLIERWDNSVSGQTINRSRDFWGQQMGNKIKIGVLGGSYPYLRIHKWDLRTLYEYDESEVPNQLITRIWQHPLAPSDGNDYRGIGNWIISVRDNKGVIDFGLIFDSFFSYFCYELISADGPKGYKLIVNSFLYTLKESIPHKSILIINYVKKKNKKTIR